MSLGKGSPYSFSKKQKINTKSSTKAELVGVDDGMSLVIWTRNFLEAQGYVVTDNVVYQDNQSAMLLEKNGRLPVDDVQDTSRSDTSLSPTESRMVSCESSTVRQRTCLEISSRSPYKDLNSASCAKSS